jgi:carbon-monoxide dehydrogenase medium subunit
MTRVLRPVSFPDACAMLAEAGPGATAVAGGTDLVVRARRTGQSPEILVDLSAIRDGGHEITALDEGVFVGALVTFERLARSDLVARTLAALSEAARAMGSLQIRSRGTLGGNVANASPAGDGVPPLIVGGAIAHLLRPGAERHLPVEDLFVGPGRSVLASDELITGFSWAWQPGFTSVWAREGDRAVHFVSKASAALSANLDGGRLRTPRVAFGAVAPVPLRARATERFLEGRALDEETFEGAMEVAMGEVRPIDDLRSTAAHRRILCATLLGRLLERLMERELPPDRGGPFVIPCSFPHGDPPR